MSNFVFRATGFQPVVVRTRTNSFAEYSEAQVLKTRATKNSIRRHENRSRIRQSHDVLVPHALLGPRFRAPLTQANAMPKAVAVGESDGVGLVQRLEEAAQQRRPAVRV